jgi:hypothetical protein
MLTGAPHTILFVHVGRTLPAWLPGALYQARIFNRGPIYLVAEEGALARGAIPRDFGVTHVALESLPVSEKQAEFRRVSPLDRNFWDGFWMFTTERFFVVESAMAHLSLKNVVHLENDVLMYADLAELAPKLERLYPGVAATFINDDLCVPGVTYFPDAAAAGRLTGGLLWALDALMRSPQFPANLPAIHDMSLLGMLRTRGREVIDHLPVVPPDYPASLRSGAGQVSREPQRYWNNFKELEFIFDGAALGQYLGGVDPRNAPQPTHGFVNQHTLFDPRRLRLRMVRDAQARSVPVVETQSGIHRVANLHIHSKNPAPFLSR